MPRPSRYATNPPPDPAPEEHDPDATTRRVQEYIEALPTFRPGSHNRPPSRAPPSAAPAAQHQQVRITRYHFPDAVPLGSPSRGPASPPTSPYAAREGPLYSAERMARPQARREYTESRADSQQRSHLIPPPPPPPPIRPILTAAQLERVTRVEASRVEASRVEGRPTVVRYHIGPRRSQGPSENNPAGEREGSSEEEGPTAKWVNEQSHFQTSGNHRRRR